MGNDLCDQITELFGRADIDDVTLNPDADESEAVELVFTERITGDNHTVAASSLDAAIDEALTVIDQHLAYRQLRGYGLADDEIANLTGSRNGLTDNTDSEAWQRGYAAGLQETTFLYEDALRRELERDTRPIIVGDAEPKWLAEAMAEPPVVEEPVVIPPPVIEQQPAMAAAGEPIQGAYLSLVKHEGDTGDGEFLALIFPVQPARA